ncbi:carboxypeptidase-like regulatory domain-containing protein [Blastopirellula marina]|uniref:Lipoprotein n=1 Tax=Blastopirellula marina DSM 3645 TaxID=314230 RepID=A3ZMT0_9BACT|nr:carboxypeptidase-like regulatory domain-containing protein [Blastopirellula marina]EAQ82256.1 hypothetical protein DSM3645_01040 [Blastopirellula marina DSM 3645]
MYASRFVYLLLLAGATVFGLGGCGHKSNLPGETGVVRGRVVYGSGTIPEGSSIVMLHVKTGIPATGLTDSAGKFAMEMRNGPDILVGDYVVNIKPPGDIGDEVLMISPATVPAEWNKVPQKYWNVKTSDETFVVDPGDNFYEFTLTDK